jgi:hypothetical protein
MSAVAWGRLSCELHKWVAFADDGWTVMGLSVFTWTLDGSGQLQAPAKFIPGKYLQIPTEYGDRSAADKFWTFLRGEKLLSPHRDSNPDRPPRSWVAILTELSEQHGTCGMLNLFFLKKTINICVELVGLRNLRIHNVSTQQSGQRISETLRTLWRQEENQDKGRVDEIGSGSEKHSNYRVWHSLDSNAW